MMQRGGETLGRNSLSRILLADDEPDILEISRIALETVGGFEVEGCDSGGELLQRLSEFKPDLVIIDFLMPDMAGLDVLRGVRRVPGFETTPVVFLTGVIRGHDLEILRESGATDVILKPFDPMALADRVNRIWNTAHDQ
jgi:two-component system OmpR family response regulator